MASLVKIFLVMNIASSLELASELFNNMPYRIETIWYKPISLMGIRQGLVGLPLEEPNLNWCGLVTFGSILDPLGSSVKGHSLCLRPWNFYRYHVSCHLGDTQIPEEMKPQGTMCMCACATRWRRLLKASPSPTAVSVLV